MGGLNETTTVPRFARFFMPLQLARASSARSRVIKKMPSQGLGTVVVSFAEREGNVLCRQYVGYQMFDLPIRADAMN